MNKRNIYILTLGLISGILVGVFIRSWDGINWSRLDYGSVADWFSGIGTILAIVSSIFIFIYSNRAKFRIQTFSNDDDSILELRVMNIGRTAGMYRYWGIKKHTDGKENLMDFSNMRLKDDSHFIALAPGEISEAKLISVGEIFTSLKFIPRKCIDTNVKADIAILLGDNSIQEVTITIENGKIRDSDNERIKK